MLQILEGFSLKKLNTFGLECIAKKYIQITDIELLKDIFSINQPHAGKLLILGGGSNVLLPEEFDGTVYHIGVRGKEIMDENDEYVWLKIGAGENWHELVMYCIKNGFGGVENLSLIPGTVGAAPMQNIGAYGVEIEQVFDHLEAVNRNNGGLQRFDHASCEFGYRQSIFKNRLKDQFVIATVTLRLTKKHQVNTSYGAIQETLKKAGISDPTIRDVSNAVINIRRSKLPDPELIGNAGSFFKNPVVGTEQFTNLQKNYPKMPFYKVSETLVKVPAGWLIEQCGWKGITRRNIGVHDNQALVLVNHGGGSGQDGFARRGKI